MTEFLISLFMLIFSIWMLFIQHHFRLTFRTKLWMWIMLFFGVAGVFTGGAVWR